MGKAVFNAAVQRAQAQEDFAHSTENRRNGPERELTHAEREGGGEFWQKRARSVVPSVEARRDRYSAAFAIQAADAGGHGQGSARSSRCTRGCRTTCAKTLATTTATSASCPVRKHVQTAQTCANAAQTFLCLRTICANMLKHAQTCANMRKHTPMFAQVIQ
jgi:hypothetical protein